MNFTVSRHSGSWVYSQSWVTVSSILMPWDPEETPNRGKALMVWCTVCSLTHGHHAESEAPILARNEAVFAQPDLRRFKRTQALRDFRSQEGFYGPHSINFRKLLLLIARHSWTQQFTIHDVDSGQELCKGSCSSGEGFSARSLSGNQAGGISLQV